MPISRSRRDGTRRFFAIEDLSLFISKATWHVEDSPKESPGDREMYTQSYGHPAPCLRYECIDVEHFFANVTVEGHEEFIQFELLVPTLGAFCRPLWVVSGELAMNMSKDRTDKPAHRSQRMHRRLSCSRSCAATFFSLPFLRVGLKGHSGCADH
jgi:hypothetical protein